MLHLFSVPTFIQDNSCIKSVRYQNYLMIVMIFHLISASAFFQSKYHHGQPHAILRMRMPEPEPEPEPRVQEYTWLIKTFSPLLFSAPDRYFSQLSNVTAYDFLNKKKDWGQFIAALEKPWNDFILYVSTLISLQTFK